MFVIVNMSQATETLTKVKTHLIACFYFHACSKVKQFLFPLSLWLCCTASLYLLEKINGENQMFFLTTGVDLYLTQWWWSRRIYARTLTYTHAHTFSFPVSLQGYWKTVPCRQLISGIRHDSWHDMMKHRDMMQLNTTDLCVIQHDPV